MMELTIALAQIPVTNDIQTNVDTIKRAIGFAKDYKADILLTPEGSLSGYTPEFDKQKMREALVDIESTAKIACVGLALGTCNYENDGTCYNQLRFYNKHGDFLGFHTKTLLCGTLDELSEGEINCFSVNPLKVFNFHGIIIGGLICNDMWANPVYTPMPDVHLSNQLAKMGAKIIFHSVNGGRDNSEISQKVMKSYHEANHRLRAISGNVWIATVDNSAPHSIPCSSYGGIVSPAGEWAYRLPDKCEQLGVCSINL
jgi:predicted amidohydrolase